ncbi:hypothetical protein C478_10953 [Natrinema thermotolerans DSM 11552]|nr:hypothetical protein C478_10953 [Natrinema thermotolerans DSM 11552]
MTDTVVSEVAFARTYDGGDYEDAWAAVEQYRRAITYHTDNPDAEIATLMRVSGASRNSIVSWITDGATPPPVKGLYTAYDYSVVTVPPEDITALNVLAAHALTAGSISEHNYQPTFTVDAPANSLAANALELLGFGCQELENGAADSNPTIGPATDAAILGRALTVLGVPTGNKTDYEDLSLPPYLHDAPDPVRRQFVDIYLENRARPKAGSAGLIITEDRPQSYREMLAELIESVAGERVTATKHGVTISADAARSLGIDRRDDGPTYDEPVIDPDAFARTYQGGGYDDPVAAVEEYRTVMDYAADHPDAGSQAIATALDLPRSRIRTWLEDDGSPDVVRGLETAREYGWLVATYDDPEFTALNTLVADIFSGGSITDETYVPSFTLNHRGEDSHVLDALELAGVEYQVLVDRDGRADEVRPTTDASVLGRVLAVLGAPVGPKANQRLSLPGYLEDAPDEIREQFVYAYLENRAIAHEGKETLTIREDRNQDYLESLAALIDDVAGGGVQFSERDIVISADAARSLGQVV